jgi:hypothetical protein
MEIVLKTSIQITQKKHELNTKEKRESKDEQNAVIPQKL